MNIQQLIIQAMISIVPMMAAYFAYRQATRANQRTVESTERIAVQNATLERDKVDALAYERARGIYESSLTQLRSDLDDTRRELREERDKSRYLQGRLDTLERELRDHGPTSKDPGTL